MQNRQFHRGIIEAAESARLTKILARIVEQPIVWRTVQNFDRDDLLHSYHEHESLLAAFASHDGVWAASVMATHIRRAFHTYSAADRGSQDSASLPDAVNQRLNLYPTMAGTDDAG